MIHTDRAIVVEGKYDKIKLDGVVDGVIIPTKGFSIYKDKEKQALLRALAQRNGLIVLTDSDRAGFQIRSFLRSICGKENIVDVYIPDLYGKEKRKAHHSKEGKLGVEGVPVEVVRQAFERAGIGCEERPAEERRPITKADLMEFGLSGGKNSSSRRQALLKRLDLPEHLSVNSLLPILNALMDYEEFVKQAGQEEKERE